MKAKKRGRTIAIISASVILLLVVLYFISHKETDILNVSADEIKSIYVTNGSNGDMVDVPSSVFPDFAKALNEVKLKRGQKWKAAAGTMVLIYQMVKMNMIYPLFRNDLL